MNQAPNKKRHAPQFDLKVHARDAKGNIIRANPYRLTIKHGVKEYERPPGSGYFYAENGSLLRSPKEQAMSTPEITDAEIQAQIDLLQAKLGAKAEPAESVIEEESEVHMTVDDVETDDVEVSASADLSEELALMEQAGADTAELKKSLFNKPSFLK